MTMEYEVKIPVSDIDEIERRLKDLGATLIDEVEEEDYYVDLNPCIDLKSKDMALRIRFVHSKQLKRRISELTFKGPRMVPNMKIRKEISTRVEDGTKVIEIFKELGFRYYVVSKRRKVYRYGPYKIFLDHVEGLGTFLEIEVENVSSVEEFLDMVKKLVTVLKVPENFIAKSYLELLLERIDSKAWR
ncbi:MAG TPA: class IV adenylate cyclase [Ignisphaera sp.]|nr:class IV adenylate cyclase [Ignisphaera sp.]